jgi:hypothetical protein
VAAAGEAAQEVFDRCHRVAEANPAVIGKRIDLGRAVLGIRAGGRIEACRDHPAGGAAAIIEVLDDVRAHGEVQSPLILAKTDIDHALTHAGGK